MLLYVFLCIFEADVCKVTVLRYALSPQRPHKGISRCADKKRNLKSVMRNDTRRAYLASPWQGFLPALECRGTHPLNATGNATVPLQRRGNVTLSAECQNAVFERGAVTWFFFSFSPLSDRGNLSLHQPAAGIFQYHDWIKQVVLAEETVRSDTKRRHFRYSTLGYSHSYNLHFIW